MSEPKSPAVPPVVRPAHEDDDDGTVVLERRTEKTKPPQMYQVVLLNDDYTPMEFVVFVIQEFFGKDRDTAIAIMLKVHVAGKGVCGVFSRDIATTKVNVVMEAAQNAGHPLQAVAEPID
ncbi:MAG: ATP-dependent Clp protease adapter ClpS [Cytophagales bacterium]|nr:ATP-dependent Clp protease adapter ClpS [Cytophagales bacterium]